jgi:hypothetical protein
MDIHSWLNSVAVFLSLCVAAVSLRLAFRRSQRLDERELAEIRVKVDTMWNFLLRRGVAEGVNNGLLTMNSPVRLTPESARIMEVLGPELRAFREKDCPNADEKTLAIAIEEKFGDRLLKEVCIPNNITYGVCLLIATAVAKGEHELTEILNEYIPQSEE